MNKNNMLCILLSLLSMNTLFGAQRPHYRVQSQQATTLDDLIEERGDIQTELDKLYKPQWYNLYGYGTNVSDQNKPAAQRLLLDHKAVDQKISEKQWGEQDLLLRSGYRMSQAALLYLAVIGTLYGTQDYWKVITGTEGAMSFGQLAIAPLMKILRLNLKINEKALDRLEKKSQILAGQTVQAIQK